MQDREAFLHPDRLSIERNQELKTKSCKDMEWVKRNRKPALKGKPFIEVIVNTKKNGVSACFYNKENGFIYTYGNRVRNVLQWMYLPLPPKE